MKAWRVEGQGEPRQVLALGDVALPATPPGMLRIRVDACALGLPDLFMCRGSYALTPKLPFTPGQEVAGRVVDAGEGAAASVGDRVMGVSAFFLGHGGFAEEAFALDDFAFRIPDDMSADEAAAFTIPYHTAYVGMVRRGALVPGETLLVIGGAGGTGSAAIQLGAALGARVLATARGVKRAAFCRELGAVQVFDPSDGSLADGVRDATEGRGADVVYDTVGGDAFDAATRCIAHEGRLLVVGFASGRWGQPVASHLVTHNYSVVGVMPSGYDRAFKLEAQRELMGHRAAGVLRVPLGDRFAFEALPDGLEQLARGAVLGKSVLRVA